MGAQRQREARVTLLAARRRSPRLVGPKRAREASDDVGPQRVVQCVRAQVAAAAEVVGLPMGVVLGAVAAPQSMPVVQVVRVLRRAGGDGMGVAAEMDVEPS